MLGDASGTHADNCCRLPWADRRKQLGALCCMLHSCKLMATVCQGMLQVLNTMSPPSPHTPTHTQVCRDTVTKTCRCGQTSRAVQCHQEVLCERRCNATKACGRHPCKRRCCDGNHAACEETCNRKLRCGNHRCPAPCHTGPCRWGVCGGARRGV